MIFEKIKERLNELCEQTYYNSVNGNRDEGIRNNAYHNAIDIINQVEAEGGWIPCEVELPKIATSYLVAEEVIVNSKKLYVVDIRLFGTEDEWLCPSNRKIIAWQPLPQPPKGE